MPTPLRKTRDPDLSYVVQGRRDHGARAAQGPAVILESTTYPGTTDEVVQPALEAKGLKAGEDFYLAFSPERVDPGNPTYQHARTSRKWSAASTRRAPRRRCAFYRQVIDTVVPVSSTRVAEMVKLLENTFRAVNIGLVNELALMCHRMNIDVWEVIDAAKTKPFGFMPFYPGPGLGGHCIPIDPFYLSWKARQSGFEARFIELAGNVNGAMPEYVVERIAEALNSAAQGDQRIARARVRRRLQARRQRHARVAGARHHGAAGAPRRRGQLHRSVRAGARARHARSDVGAGGAGGRRAATARSSSPTTRCSTTPRIANDVPAGRRYAERAEGHHRATTSSGCKEVGGSGAARPRRSVAEA